MRFNNTVRYINHIQYTAAEMLRTSQQPKDVYLRNQYYVRCEFEILEMNHCLLSLLGITAAICHS